MVARSGAAIFARTSATTCRSRSLPCLVPASIYVSRKRRASGYPLPDADVDAVRAVRVGAGFDKRVVDRRAPLAGREPVEQALAQPRALGREARIGAEVGELARIVGEPEELRAEAFPVHVLPFAVADHPRAAFAHAAV